MVDPIPLDLLQLMVKVINNLQYKGMDFIITLVVINMDTNVNNFIIKFTNNFIHHYIFIINFII